MTGTSRSRGSAGVVSDGVGAAGFGMDIDSVELLLSQSVHFLLDGLETLVGRERTPSHSGRGHHLGRSEVQRDVLIIVERHVVGSDVIGELLVPIHDALSHIVPWHRSRDKPTGRKDYATSFVASDVACANVCINYWAARQGVAFSAAIVTGVWAWEVHSDRRGRGTRRCCRRSNCCWSGGR